MAALSQEREAFCILSAVVIDFYPDLADATQERWVSEAHLDGLAEERSFHIVKEAFLSLGLSCSYILARRLPRRDQWLHQTFLLHRLVGHTKV